MNGIKSFFSKKTIKKLIDYIKSKKETLILSLPLVLLYIFGTILCLKVPYGFKSYYAPILFTISYIILFVGVSTNIKKPFGKLLYILINFVFIIMYFANGVYFSLTKNVFDFSLTESASEGAPYIVDTILKCNISIFIFTAIIIAGFVYALRHFPKNEESSAKGALTCILIFLVMNLLTPYTLGRENNELTWSSWRNARNIYNAYNDSNKSMKISGIFEYTVRNFYLTFLRTEEEENEEDNEFLVESHEEIEKNNNKYTGVLNGKNLIIIQLEGMDNWIINENDTPTIYKMMNESINFDNHFSFYNGGGSTFNSEFAINTGYITPFSYNKNAYSFNKNSFPYSLANLFKNEGYKVNAFHMNSGEYYSRKINYKNWGYDNYYGLKDLGTYEDASYELDRELILNEDFNTLMFPEDTKFVDYIITYSGHLPFTNTKGVCKMLYEEDKAKESENNEVSNVANNEEQTTEETEDDFVEMTEEECIRKQNKETDYMMSLLLEKLEEKELINDTAIVVITDHYLYTISDLSIIARYKETSNNMINETPFFIWSKNLSKNNIKEVTTQLNVLPTILNLYGIKYNPNNYIAEDALDSNYKGLAFFSDYSWYDGKTYFDSTFDMDGNNINKEDIENKNYKVSYLARKNDLTLKFNYFNR